MAVAPSFENFEKLCEPFTENGKQYIKVRNPKTKTERKVRWYTDAEYSKTYPNKELTVDQSYGGLKHARGYDNGPILVIRNNKPSDEVWLGASCARYAVGVGWYIISTATLPADAPSHFKYLLLSWEETKDGDDNHIKSPTELQKLLAKKARAGQYVNMVSSR